ANPDDSVRRAVAVPVASYDSDASCCCRGCYRAGCCPNRDCDHDSDRVPTAGDVAAPVAAVAAADVVAAIPSRDCVAVAGAAVPNAAAVPGLLAVAAAVAAPSAAAVLDYLFVAAGDVVPNVAAAPVAAAAEPPGYLVRGLAGGFVVPVGVAAGADRARPGFPASAPRHDRGGPGHSQYRLRP